MSEFRQGDIVRIQLPAWNRHFLDICPYDAILTKQLVMGDNHYQSDEEKWYFRMLQGPLSSDGTNDYFCVPTHRMHLQVQRPPVDVPPKKGLPNL